jgi:hypothetical protein
MGLSRPQADFQRLAAETLLEALALPAMFVGDG